MDYEHISFIEALKIAADKAGIVLDVESNIQKPSNKLYDIYEISNKFYLNNINTKDGVIAKEYLEARGINSDIIKEFKIGLSSSSSLTNVLKEKGFEDNDLIDSGLCIKKDGIIKDIFYNRIIFPLFDLNGKVVAYSGRIYNTEDTSKYINTKETSVFKKGELLYNFHRAKDRATQTQTIYVMEGFLDVIASHMVGIYNVVATMGTAVTKEQAQLIKRLAKNVVLCFDGDSAGKKATYACANELIKIGVIPSVVMFDNNLDPDEYIKNNGKNSFIDKLDNPISIMDFKLKYFKENVNFNNNVEVSNYVNNMLNEINLIKDDILKELTIQKLSEETKIDIELLKSKVITHEEKVIVKDKPKYSKYEKAEKNLLYYMLNKEEVIKIYNKNISCLPSKLGRSLANKINDFYQKYDMINIADLLSTIDDKEMYDYIKEILALDLNDIYKIDEIHDYINVINDYNYELAISRLNENLKNTTSTEEKIKIGQEILKLKLGRNEND